MANGSVKMNGADVRGTMLVVDDDAFMRQFPGLVTESQLPGVKAETAHCPVVAIRKLREGLAANIDFVLSDIQMPNHTGIDLARILRGEIDHPEMSPETVDRLRNVPIVLTSADDAYLCPDSPEGLVIADLHRRGVIHGFMAKPFSVAHLVEVLKDAMGGSLKSASAVLTHAKMTEEPATA